MELRSLGHRTDLLFPRFDGQVDDRGAYLVVRTPSNPGFYFGNFLLFDRPPQPGDRSRWLELFAREIGAPPEVGHVVLAWDAPDGAEGALAEFLEAGFEVEATVVLAAHSIRAPPNVNPALEVRPLTTPRDWDEALALELLCRPESVDALAFRDFKLRQMARYREMADRSLGGWFGAFLGGTLVAGLGLFRIESLGRYQYVLTHPAYRRQGACGTLVWKAGTHALREWRLERLVIIAAEGSDAARLYASLGFEPVEHLRALVRYPRET